MVLIDAKDEQHHSTHLGNCNLSQAKKMSTEYMECPIYCLLTYLRSLIDDDISSGSREYFGVVRRILVHVIPSASSPSINVKF